ncbi:MAG: 2-aminoethylphosphonate--pyruvate transaminase [Epsilonproteobacteria bacterium]|nr:2-aminoethylphosphonate--pyruvate transaminase [Campylobacterota bacterium]
MKTDIFPDNPYLLLTPGPLSTTKSVKAAMLKDWGTWDNDYKNLVQKIRQRLVRLATNDEQSYTAVLMQGSGTFSVESVVGSVIPDNAKLLVLVNGAYGRRMADIAEFLQIPTLIINAGDLAIPDLFQIKKTLLENPEITHVAAVHCETTTGIINPVDEISRIVKSFNKVFIVDAMSSFGGIPLNISDLNIDFLISSANKCIQGVPGFGFIIAKVDRIKQCKDRARSLSLNLYDQWKIMEGENGRWRFTSPTHVVSAFHQALLELEKEGGIAARYKRYCRNQEKIVKGMAALGFNSLLPRKLQSPIITSFYYPNEKFEFIKFYEILKKNGFLIYPGKLSNISMFRIGSIGDINFKDIDKFLSIIKDNKFW